FPIEEIEKFAGSKPSLVDQFIQDPTQTLEALDSGSLERDAQRELHDRADGLVADAIQDEPQEVPVVETKDVLDSLGLHVIRSADEEAVEYLTASAVAKLWKHAYHDEAQATFQAEAFSGEGYAEQVRTKFLEEYRQAKDLSIPTGYA